MSLEDYESEAIQEIIECGDRPKAYDAARAARHPKWPGGFASFQTYLALYDYTSLGKNIVWASKAALASNTGLSVRMVSRHLKALVEGGVIERSPRTAKGGRQTSNQYVLPREPIDTWSWEVGEHRDTRTAWREATRMTPSGVTKMSETRLTRMSPLEVVPGTSSCTKQQAGLNLPVEPLSLGTARDAPGDRPLPLSGSQIKADPRADKGLHLCSRLSGSNWNPLPAGRKA